METHLRLSHLLEHHELLRLGSQHMEHFVRIISLPLAWVFWAQAVTPTDTFWVVRLVETFGLPIALVIFFVWQWYKDKERMGTRISKLEEWIETTAMTMHEENMESRGSLKNSLDKMTDALAKKPCMYEESKNNKEQ